MTRKISQVIDLISEKIGIFTAYLILPMIIITFLVAFMRYVLDVGSIAIQEIIIYLHALVFSVGAAFTLKNDMHVRIDIFYSNYKRDFKKIINILGASLFLIPTCILIFITSWDYVISSILLLESSKEAGGLPILYILKSYILLLCITLFFQAISEIFKNLNREKF
tara:strand:+ start:950 stop:1447 length:498 start_codon:yes stop_codon:yes gene_type:complete